MLSSSDRLPFITRASEPSRGVVLQEAAQGNPSADNEAASGDGDGKVIQQAGAADEKTGLQTVRKGTDPTVRPSGKGRAHLYEVVVAADAAAGGTADGSRKFFPVANADEACDIDRDDHVIGACIAEKAKPPCAAVTCNDLDFKFGRVTEQPVLTGQEAFETSGLVESAYQGIAAGNEEREHRERPSTAEPCLAACAHMSSTLGKARSGFRIESDDLVHRVVPAGWK